MQNLEKNEILFIDGQKLPHIEVGTKLARLEEDNIGLKKLVLLLLESKNNVVEGNNSEQQLQIRKKLNRLNLLSGTILLNIIIAGWFLWHKNGISVEFAPKTALILKLIFENMWLLPITAALFCYILWICINNYWEKLQNWTSVLTILSAAFNMISSPAAYLLKRFYTNFYITKDNILGNLSGCTFRKTLSIDECWIIINEAFEKTCKKSFSDLDSLKQLENKKQLIVEELQKNFEKGKNLLIKTIEELNNIAESVPDKTPDANFLILVKTFFWKTFFGQYQMLWAKALAPLG